jgi:2-oxoglutarate dehydrogenase E2 component (dihydrolipoamide succinyltransferase)
VRRVGVLLRQGLFRLLEARRAGEVRDVAIVRIEQLYPFPSDEYIASLRRYPNAIEFVWCQEEPQNQGAWYQIRHRLQEPLGPRQELLYAGRAPAAAPATGIPQLHAEQQHGLVNAALTATIKEESARETSRPACDRKQEGFMTIEVRVPQLPESVADATLVAWRKQPGDSVQRDENLVDLETDKVVLEVPAPTSGVLQEIRVQNGATVTSGQILAVLAPGDVAAATATKADGAGKAEPTGKAESAAKADKAPAAPAKARESRTSAPAATERLAPSVRRLVEEHHLEPQTIAGSGRDGRITKGDVLTHLAAAKEPSTGGGAAPSREQTPSPAAGPSAATGARDERRVPMTRLRARIAERLVEAQATAAMLTTFNEVDLTAVNELRTRYKDRFEKEHGARLGFMSFFVKASIEALRRFPLVNASVDGNDIVYHEYYDIGVAVSTDRGLIVPVLRDADTMSFADIEKSVVAYANRAREGAITLAELTWRHVHDHEWRRVRLAAVDADPQHSAERHTRHAQDPGSTRRDRRTGGRAADDVSRDDLRPSDHRRSRSRPVPGGRQGCPRGSRSAALADLSASPHSPSAWSSHVGPI